MKRYFAMVMLALVTLTGCSSLSDIGASADKAFISRVMGDNYDVNDNGDYVVSYGEVLATEDLAGGSTLYVHAIKGQTTSSGFAGIYGKVQYAYRVAGFKVKDGKVVDWAYGLYSPDKEYTMIFGIILGYDAQPVYAEIREQYPELIKTSKDASISTWR